MHQDVPETFQIKVVSITGQKFRINVCASDPVLAVLTTLGNYLQLAPNRLHLVLMKSRYTSLSNSNITLVEYGVRHGDTLQLQPATIQSGPFDFTMFNRKQKEELQRLSQPTIPEQRDEHSAPQVMWSDAPATAPVTEQAISYERQIENDKLRRRMNDVRSRIEARKQMRRPSVGTS
eukprot:CFRG6506T1